MENRAFGTFNSLFCSNYRSDFNKNRQDRNCKSEEHFAHLKVLIQSL